MEHGMDAAGPGAAPQQPQQELASPEEAAAELVCHEEVMNEAKTG